MLKFMPFLKDTFFQTVWIAIQTAKQGDKPIMMRTLCNGMLVLILTGLCSLTQAATVSGLYFAELLVPEQLTQPADTQLQQGLKRVLVKVSGRSQVVNKPAVVEALQRPAALLSQFSYQSTQTPVAAGDGREVLGQLLLLEFDPVLIDQLLQNAGMQAIGHARPVMMVWLAAQRDNAARDFVAPESRLYTQLAQLAKARGLPLDAPLLDLNDQSALNVSDLWGFFREPIEQASDRYKPEAILAGRLIQGKSGGWQTEWLLLKEGQARSFSPTGALSNQLQQVINESADFVLSSLGSSRFNYVETGLQLEVTNIDGVDDYLQLLSYLNQLPPVEAIRVSAVDADRVLFRVELQGGVQAMEQAVRLNPRMSPMPRIGGSSADPILAYRWQE